MMSLFDLPSASVQSGKSNEWCNQVICGDALVELRNLSSDSIDALCVDPPAAVSFMGRSWDSDKGGRTQWVAWLAEIMRECLRVMKPGASGLIWSLPRTSHWTAWALEDAGFEVRDCLYHLMSGDAKLATFVESLTDEQRNAFVQLVDSQDEQITSTLAIFGCLSEDTEILTSEGWVRYQTLVEDHLALCYNVNNETLGWEPIQEVLTYDYNDTAFRIHSDHTDQIVSRNHRCIVERSGKYIFNEAESLERYERVPILEDLPSVLEALHLHGQGGSRKTRDMLDSLQGQVRSDATGESRAKKDTWQYEIPLSSKEEVRSLQTPVSLHESLSSGTQQDMLQSLPGYSTKVQTQGYKDSTSSSCDDMQDVRKEVCFKDASEVLLNEMLWAMEINRSRNTCSFGEDCSQREKWMEAGKCGSAQATDDRYQQSCLEGRSNNLQETRQLRGGALCEMPTRVYRHGTQGRLCYGASSICSTGAREDFAEEGSGTSYQPRPNRQQARELTAICRQSGPQTIRASRFTRSDLATITPIYYKGVVWCVRVPSGAFVARRNGKIFITGNSGFPKSHNVSIAIDRHFKAEREVIGPRIRLGDKQPYPYTESDCNTMGHNYAERSPITVPATPEAQKYSGFGTNLKPSVENWYLVRKPLSEKTIAENVLKWGTGGLNIDACRIETDDKLGRLNHTTSKFMDSANGTRPSHPKTFLANNSDGKGRWPSHLLLSHSIFCVPNIDTDGMEEVEDWICDAACPILQLDEQSGNRKSGEHHTLAGTRHQGIRGNIAHRVTEYNNFASEGGASRFFKQFYYCSKASRKDRTANGTVENNHPTVKPLELIKYLVRLITPVNGIVLDCFAGSGTTALACIAEGFDYLLIEQDEAYCDIARARIDQMLQEVNNAS